MIEASIRMRQGTSNPSVHQALDTKIKEGQKNISYLQDSLSKLQISQSGLPPSPPPKNARGDASQALTNTQRTKHQTRLGMNSMKSH